MLNHRLTSLSFLTRMASGAKRFAGKLYDFGSSSDPTAEFNRWPDEKDDLKAGRTPREKTSAGLTLKEFCDRFLGEKPHRIDRTKCIMAVRSTDCCNHGPGPAMFV